MHEGFFFHSILAAFVRVSTDDLIRGFFPVYLCVSIVVTQVFVILGNLKKKFLGLSTRFFSILFSKLLDNFKPFYLFTYFLGTFA
jgi:hypothetical protein